MNVCNVCVCVGDSSVLRVVVVFCLVGTKMADEANRGLEIPPAVRAGSSSWELGSKA